jgi:dipeptidyl aminopeptidase/acylaminoacyl peptidase
MNTALNETGDPIRHIKGVETAMLVVHGECDARVPVGQGIGFHRGLRRMSKYPDRHTLVIYPREGHLYVVFIRNMSKTLSDWLFLGSKSESMWKT